MSRIGLENTIHHDAVEMQRGVEQRTKAVDEDHGAEAGCCTGAGAVSPQHPLDGDQENVQCGVENCRIVFQVIAQALGHREHPLAHWQARVPVPYAEPLEALCRVSEAQLVSTVREMVGQTGTGR